MSDDTQGSGSSLKSIRNRLPINKSAAGSTLKHGLDQLSGTISRGVESLKKGASQSRGGSTSVFCKGVRQLDNYGYEKYNIEDGDEIFISRHSEKSMFNEDDSLLIRATDGNFVVQPDTTKVVPVVDEPVQSAPEDVRSLFANVPRTEAQTVFTSSYGTVENGEVKVVSLDRDFLKRMTRPAMQKLPDFDEPKYEEVTIQDASADDVDAPMIMDMPEETAEVPAEAPVVIPVEEPIEETIVSPIEAAEATEAPAEIVEEFEVPVEASFEESVEFTDEIDTSAEIPVEEPAEETEAAEVPAEIEVPVEEPVEVLEEEVEVAPADIPEEIEIPVEEPVVAEPGFGQQIEVPAMDEQPEGLYVEGNQPSDAAVASAGAAVQETESTATSSGEVAEPVSAVRAVLDADGEALPPMSDPVVKRPRSVRFRFANGVLMSVDSKTEGSQEGPSRPLD